MFSKKEKEIACEFICILFCEVYNLINKELCILDKMGNVVKKSVSNHVIKEKAKKKVLKKYKCYPEDKGSRYFTNIDDNIEFYFEKIIEYLDINSSTFGYDISYIKYITFHYPSPLPLPLSIKDNYGEYIIENCFRDFYHYNGSQRELYNEILSNNKYDIIRNKFITDNGLLVEFVCAHNSFEEEFEKQLIKFAREIEIAMYDLT